MNSSTQKNKKQPLSIYEITVFSMLGATMYISKLILEWAPNIHLLGMFIIAFTLVYRKKALVPIYIFVMITGVLNGFSAWWLPYLYIWTVLWAMTMILPKNMNPKIAFWVYPLVSAIHGILYGILYAPAQAILFGLDFKGIITWILSGSVFDVAHCVGNFAAGFLIIPLTKLLRRIEKRPASI